MCGCSKRGSAPRRTTFRSNRPVRREVAPTPSFSELRALGVSPAKPETRHLDEQRRRIDRLRRDAIKKRLNK